MSIAQDIRAARVESVANTLRHKAEALLEVEKTTATLEEAKRKQMAAMEQAYVRCCSLRQIALSAGMSFSGVRTRLEGKRQTPNKRNGHPMTHDQSPVPMPLVARVEGSTVRYMQEEIGGQKIDAEVIERDWDVTSLEARLNAAIEEVGPIDERNCTSVQWFIDADRNAAALVVYRPSLFCIDAV